MQSKKLYNVYWAEGVKIIVYILNRYAIISLNKITPYEAWFEIKSNLQHLKVFGCRAYVHVNDERRRMLDAK